MSGDRKSANLERPSVVERLLDECFTIVLSIDRLADDQRGETDPAGADVRIHEAISSFERSFSMLSDLELEISILTPPPFHEELRDLLLKAKSLVQLVEPVLESLLNEAELPDSRIFDLVLTSARTLKGTLHTNPQNRLKRLREKGEALIRRMSYFCEELSDE